MKGARYFERTGFRNPAPEEPRPTPKRRLDAFLSHLQALDEVVSVYQVAGRNDLLLHVAVRDVEHMRQLVMNELSSRPEAKQIETAIVYERTRSPRLPDLVGDGE